MDNSEIVFYPTVSFIIPIFNGERYIEQFHNCILNQDSNDYEVIYVDDGSRDNTLFLLNSIANNSRYNTTIITQTNKGVSAARNTGLRIAKGKYVCFCDIDDLISPCYVSTFVNVMNSYQVDFVISGSCSVEEDMERTDNIAIPTSIMITKDALDAFLYHKIQIGVCGTCIRKEVIDKNNLLFSEGYAYSEDLHYVWRVLAYSKKIAVIKNMLYCYLKHPGSAMSKFDVRRFDGYLLMKELEPFFKKKCPDFYPQYKKYGAARVMWSIAWQAASRLPYSQFKDYLSGYNVRLEMKKCLSYPNLKVRISSLLYMISPYCYYIFLGIYGRRFGRFRNL